MVMNCALNALFPIAVCYDESTARNGTIIAILYSLTVRATIVNAHVYGILCEDLQWQVKRA
jgi:hypothetical protein